MKRTRRPTPPGEMLDLEFLDPMGLSPAQFDVKAGLAPGTTQKILDEDLKVTRDIAVCLSNALGTSAEIWEGLQKGVDDFDAGLRNR